MIMGLFDSFMGNASKINKEELAREFSPMLADNEHIEQAFAVFRDKWVFTNRRLIILNVQGMTGKKREYMSIPYRSIVRYSIEMAGTFDLDAELKIWLSGSDIPFEQKFNSSSNLPELQRMLALHIL